MKAHNIVLETIGCGAGNFAKIKNFNKSLNSKQIKNK